MSNVLTVEAKLNGDAASLVAAAKRAVDALDKLQESGKKATALAPEFDNLGLRIGNALGVAVVSTAKFGGKVIEVTGNVIKTLAGLTIKAALAGAAIGGVFGGTAIKAGLDRLMSIQDATVALTRMLGSAESAANLTKKALDVVKGTPFAFPAFAEATRTLVAFGVSAEMVPGVLQAIADSAAASGKGAEAVSGLTEAFAKLKVQGKMSSDILQSLGTSGVNGLGILANHFGVTTAEAQTMVTDGLIPADEAMQILVDGIEKGSDGAAGKFNSLAGAAQDLGKTVSGSLGNVKAAFARMGASWLKPFEVDFPRVLNDGVIPLLDKLGAAGGRMTKMLSDSGALDKVLNGFKNLIKYVDPAADSFLGVLRSLSPLMLAFNAVKGILPDVSAALAPVGRLIQSQFIPALAQLAAAVVPLIPAFAQLLSAGMKGMIEVMPAVVSVVNALVQVAVPLIQIISALPAPFLGVIGVLGSLSAMGLPIPGILGSIGEAIVIMLAKMAGVEAAGTIAQSGLGKFVSGIGGVMTAIGPAGLGVIAVAGAAFGVFAAHAAEVSRETDAIAASLDRVTGAMTVNTRAAVTKMLADDGALQAANSLGISLGTVTDAAMGNADAIAFVNAKYAEHNDKVTAASEDIGGLSSKLSEADGNYATLMGAIGEVTGESEKAIAANQLQAQAMDEVKRANDAYTETLTKTTAALATNGATLDQSTQQGMGNVAALNEVANASNTVVGAMMKEGQSHEEVSKRVATARDRFVEMASKMGMSSSEAAILASKLIGIPNVKRAVEVDTSAAMRNIAALRAAISAVDARVQAGQAIAQGAGYVRAGATGGITKAMANGGLTGAHGRVTAAANGLHRTSMMAKGGDNILWAEPETGWEAYISGNDKSKQRNQDIWMQAGEKLGMFKDKGDGGGGGGVQVQIVNKSGVALSDLIDMRIKTASGWQAVELQSGVGR